ncbi:MAG: DnaJ domain-containing protein [Stappiaceae bacterium]
MPYFFLGVAALVLLVFAAKRFVAASPADLARQIKQVSGGVLLFIAAILMFTGRWVFGLAVAGFGLSLLGLGGIPGFGRVGGSRPTSGKISTVRTAMLEMQLDHDSGAMRGRVIAGTYDGSDLDQMDRDMLRALWLDCGADEESRALLEAYFDRRNPSWREDFDANESSGQSASASTGAMTDKEAYQVLGLSPGAGKTEIREAHRRLMIRLHPDRGGSTFLAAKINQAKDRLLSGH